MQLCHIHFYQKIAHKKVARVNAALKLDGLTNSSKSRDAGVFLVTLTETFVKTLVVILKDRVEERTENCNGL